MIVHDERFEELAVAPVKQTDVKVTAQLLGDSGYEDATPVWGSSDLLMQVKIDSMGEMLGAATKKATVNLLGIVDNVGVDDIFKIVVGLYDNDESAFNYISQGFFIVETIDYNYDAGSTTITMYDHMWKAANTLYTEAVSLDFITYPISVKDFATEIAGLLEVSLDPDFDELPNADYMIAEDLYSTISTATLKNVVRDIAGATGSTARINETTMYFTPYTVSDDNLDSDSLKTLKIGETYGPITSVVLGRLPQNDNIAIFATAPADNEVTSVDTINNTLTIVDNGMSDGNMVRLQTTGTFPAPLISDKSYYVYTNGDPDVFSLAPTYEDGINGTNLINITSSGSGVLTIPTLTTREIAINNNEILDDEREILLPGLYNKLSGIEWTSVKADTIGLGWFEVGDVVQFTQGFVTVKAFISEVHVTLAGSIKEQVISTVPETASINYAAAGGILKKLYNTEIKVDKQQQQITSVVSAQTELEGSVNESLTQIYQDIDDITLTVQKSGGGNLIKNSVGFATEKAFDDASVQFDKLSSWNYQAGYEIAENGTVTSYDSSESQNKGGVSGRVIRMNSDFGAGKSVTITQRVNVAAGVSLSFGVRVKNNIGQGDVTITLSNDNETFTLDVLSANSYDWQELKLENFVTTQPFLDVEISSGAGDFLFTDLRLLYGSTLQSWSQANTEILSANVQFTLDGMRIFDESHDTETRVTYNEFSTRRKNDGLVLFEADDSGVVTNDLKIKGVTSYEDADGPVIKQLTIPNTSPLAGIVFVKGQ